MPKVWNTFSVSSALMGPGSRMVGGLANAGGLPNLSMSLLSTKKPPSAMADEADRDAERGQLECGMGAPRSRRRWRPR